VNNFSCNQLSCNNPESDFRTSERDIPITSLFNHPLCIASTAGARKRAGFKNPEILIRSVSRHRLEDQSRNMRVVVADVAARTVGGAIYRGLRGGSSASEGLFHAAAMRFIFLNQRRTAMRSQRQFRSLLAPITPIQIAIATSGASSSPNHGKTRSTG